MTAEHRTASLTAAIDDLTWLTTAPHCLGQVVGIYAETIAAQPMRFSHGTSLDDMLDVLRSGGIGSGRSKGDHADPTADAVLAGHPAATDDADGTLGSIDHAVKMILTHATELDAACTTALSLPTWNRIDRKRTRDDDLSDALACLHATRPNLEPAIDADPSKEGHLTWLLRSPIAETSSWLRRKAEAIWQASKGEQYLPAEQKPIVECSNCSPWRRNQHAIKDTLCAECWGFRDDWKALPTEEIVRAWDYGRRRLTPAMIERARQAKPKRRKVTA